MPDVQTTIAARIGEAEERLRSSIAARISRNRDELARLQEEQREFENVMLSSSRTSPYPSLPTATGDSAALSPRPYPAPVGERSDVVAAEPKGLAVAAAAGVAESAAALSAAVAEHRVPKAALSARTPPTAPASVARSEAGPAAYPGTVSRIPRA